MTTRLSQTARDVYRALYPLGPTQGSTLLATWLAASTLSMRETAAKLGCTEASLRGWAHGRRVPTIEFGRRIHELAGVPIVSWVIRTDEDGRPLREPDSEVEFGAITPLGGR